MATFHMTSVHHHGIQANSTRCGRAFNEDSCGGSHCGEVKILFLDVAGLIVLCSSVDHR